MGLWVGVGGGGTREGVGGRRKAPQRVIVTRWGSIGPAFVRETHQRVVGGSLGCRWGWRDEGGGVEVGGRRKTPQRVIVTRWGSIGPASVMQTHQRFVGGLVGPFRGWRGEGVCGSLVLACVGRWCWHRRWKVDRTSQKTVKTPVKTCKNL